MFLPVPHLVIIIRLLSLLCKQARVIPCSILHSLHPHPHIHLPLVQWWLRIAWVNKSCSDLSRRRGVPWSCVYPCICPKISLIYYRFLDLTKKPILYITAGTHQLQDYRCSPATTICQPAPALPRPALLRKAERKCYPQGYASRYLVCYRRTSL